MSATYCQEKVSTVLHAAYSLFFLYFLFFLLFELILFSAHTIEHMKLRREVEGTHSLMSFGFSRRLTAANLRVFLALTYRNRFV